MEWVGTFVGAHGVGPQQEPVIFVLQQSVAEGFTWSGVESDQLGAGDTFGIEPQSEPEALFGLRIEFARFRMWLNGFGAER